MIATVEHNKTWSPESKADFAWCQKHFIAYSLNKYEVKKKTHEAKDTRLIINCPICFRERRGKMKELKKPTKPYPSSLPASSSL